MENSERLSGGSQNAEHGEVQKELSVQKAIKKMAASASGFMDEGQDKKKRFGLFGRSRGVSPGFTSGLFDYRAALCGNDCRLDGECAAPDWRRCPFYRLI